ncbi:TAXI family TRAP transporter solute-binding subunit [Actinomadura harenae]|uniref:TAXI family TRAP transporter solute-binding subunit n=1 Tax=Actinomadura harenae TaxID=2483351 RepID=A0A3M2LLA3_9ACTN|nr:TAXI family TRAP transporter solute-binding subunit [Actinomadura harenae]RMI37640.1 TAXI family TRAP transporter solute-binding subunit [Actinomadura harenae]
MERRSVLVAAAALAAGGTDLLGAACGGAHAPTVLRLATGEKGGPYQALGDRFAAELRRGGFKVRAVTTNASVQNLSMLADGTADLAFALADSADQTVQAEHRPAAALARMYMNFVHLIVHRDAPVRTISDLAGRSVSLGADGSGTAVTAERVMSVADLARPARILRYGLERSIEALKADEVVAAFWSGGVLTPALTTLSRQVPIRLVPLDDRLVMRLRRAYGPVYDSASVPANAYGEPEPVPTVSAASYLMCRVGLPDDVAFKVTKRLFSSRDRLRAPEAPGGRLDRRFAIGTGAVPLHPGAARYYRSVFG